MRYLHFVSCRFDIFYPLVSFNIHEAAEFFSYFLCFIFLFSYQIL